MPDKLTVTNDEQGSIFDGTKVSECKCLKLLVDNGFLPFENMINLSDGKSFGAVVLREIKCSAKGRISVGRKWIQVLYCPACGSKLTPRQIL